MTSSRTNAQLFGRVPILQGLFAWAVLLLSLALAPQAAAQFEEKIIEEGKAFTVQILALDGQGQPLSTGSGFFISEEGHVATNRHVVEDGAEFIAIFASKERVFLAPAKVAAESRQEDIAILKTRKFPGARVTTLAVGQPSSGQRVMAIGFPGALDYDPSLAGFKEVRPGEFKGNAEIIAACTPTTFSGEVGKMLKMMGIDLVAHSAKISQGNSGGPLIDLSGRVVGMNTWLLSNQDNPGERGSVDYGIAVHSSQLAELAELHGIRVKTTRSKAVLPGSHNLFSEPLVWAVTGLAVVSFLMVLRRPRAVVVDGLSRLTGHRSHRGSELRAGGNGNWAPAPAPAPQPASGGGHRMVLRGRDQEGHSFHLEFDARTFQNNGGQIFLGRNRDLCQLHLPQDSVSRRHAAFRFQNGSVLVEDRNSGNGTAINGHELALGNPPAPLRPGDRLRVGEVELIFDILS